MKRAYLDIDGYWGCVVIYDYDVDLEYEDLWAIIESFGVSPKQARHSLEILAAPNTGMTVTFPEIKMSLVMISRATSREQMFNTIAHEAYHATCGIIRFYGREMCSEDAAYTMGEIMRQIVTEMSI